LNPGNSHWLLHTLAAKKILGAALNPGSRRKLLHALEAKNISTFECAEK
jgi:hypothetical protein